MNSPRPYPRGFLIEAFDIDVTGPGGNRLQGRLYQGSDHPTGRLVRVFDGAKVLYECESIDQGNATDRLDWWLAAQPFVPIPAVWLDKFDAGGFRPAFNGDGKPDDIITVYYLRWKADRDAAGAKAQAERCDVCGLPVGDDGQRVPGHHLCAACVGKVVSQAATFPPDLGGEAG